MSFSDDISSYSILPYQKQLKIRVQVQPPALPQARPPVWLRALVFPGPGTRNDILFEDGNRLKELLKDYNMNLNDI